MRYPQLAFALLAIAGLATGALADPVPFSCTIGPGGKTIRVAISNPFDRETHCQVNCQFSTQNRGTSLQLSCGKTVAAGATDVELCLRAADRQVPVKMTGGDGDCVKQLSDAEQAAKEKAEDEDDEKLIKDLMKQSDEFIKRQRAKNPPQ